LLLLRWWSLIGRDHSSYWRRWSLVGLDNIVWLLSPTLVIRLLTYTLLLATATTSPVARSSAASTANASASPTSRWVVLGGCYVVSLGGGNGVVGNGWGKEIVRCSWIHVQPWIRGGHRRGGA
jgi:hypothetical protein